MKKPKKPLTLDEKLSEAQFRLRSDYGLYDLSDAVAEARNKLNGMHPTELRDALTRLQCFHCGERILGTTRSERMREIYLDRWRRAKDGTLHGIPTDDLPLLEQGECPNCYPFRQFLDKSQE